MSDTHSYIVNNQVPLSFTSVMQYVSKNQGMFSNGKSTMKFLDGSMISFFR